MTTNNTPNLKKDTNPNAKWDSNLVNEELVNLDTAISNLTTGLVTTNTDQTVSSQKTFYSIYPKNNQLTSYDSIMDELPYNVSPVFGASSYSLQGNKSLEEGAYTKPRVDGARMPAANLNPLYFPSSITIDYDGDTTMTIKAINVPVPITNTIDRLYDYGKDNQPYFYKTSISYNGTVTGLSLSSSRISVVYLIYNIATDSVTVEARLDEIVTTSIAQDLTTIPIGLIYKSHASHQSNGVVVFKTPFLFVGQNKALKTISCFIKASPYFDGNKIWYSSSVDYVPASAIAKPRTSTNAHIQSEEYFFPSTPDFALGYSGLCLVSEIHFGDLLK